jgi:hypothetical protein
MTSHGTYERYVEGCECKPCRGAFKRRCAIKNALSRSGAPKTGVSKNHGTRWCYENGCRCSECRGACAKYQKQHRQEKLQNA